MSSRPSRRGADTDSTVEGYLIEERRRTELESVDLSSTERGNELALKMVGQLSANGDQGISKRLSVEEVRTLRDRLDGFLEEHPG